MKRTILFLSLSLLLGVALRAQQREVTIVDEDTPAPTAAAPRDTVPQRREVIIVDEPTHFPVNIIREGRPGDARRGHGKIIYESIPGNDEDGWHFIPMIGLGYNGLVQDLRHMELPADAEWLELEPRSMNFRLRLAEYAINPDKHFGIQAGLELEAANFRFSHNMMPTLDRDGYVVEGPVGYTLKKSKLVNTFLNIPLVLRVGFGHKNQLTLYGGVVGGWRISSYIKEKSAEFGKDHHRGNLNLLNFHYGYTGGIKFHKVGIYASYYPHSIFKADKGPDVRQATIGFSLFY
jgi:hypothetical protein